MPEPTQHTVEEANKLLMKAEERLEAVAQEAANQGEPTPEIEHALEDAETEVTIAKARLREAERRISEGQSDNQPSELETR